MNLTARGSVEYVGTPFDPWADDPQGEDHPSPWSATPDPEESALLDRWITLLPSRYREDLTLMREGLTTADAGRALGCSQPHAWLRREVAQDALRWAVATLPILTPSEVYETVLEATENVDKAEGAGWYWEHWATTGHPVLKQGTMWARLFGVPPMRRSFTYIYRSEPGPVGVVARALWSIHTRPGWVRARKHRR